jgi:hypothetical protein
VKFAGLSLRDRSLLRVNNALQASRKDGGKTKKEQGAKPCSKIVSTLNFPENLDLILIDGATLLVRARVPPETWTTRLKPLGQPEVALVDYLFRLVTIFGNDCSKFEQSAK